ncbi:MAG: GCN5-related N-acetyltransferase [Rickettsiaceae bacterium]|jgi:RimJ/RimL family protein N-acetyltransferase|nr:GCN5-related N-acetyltransferase [Rickettsiaceae bacterium]
MLYHNNFRIRPAEEEDLGFLTSLRTSQYVQENVGQFIFVNQINQKEWLANISKSRTEKFMIFEVLAGDIYEKIGMIRLSSIDLQNRSVCVGGDILENKSGQGYGKIMYEMIFKLCFKTWDMNRVWLSVLEDNERAIKLYKKMGFVDEGRQREAIYKDGKHVDYLMMSILKNEFNKK